MGKMYTSSEVLDLLEKTLAKAQVKEIWDVLTEPGPTEPKENIVSTGDPELDAILGQAAEAGRSFQKQLHENASADGAECTCEICQSERAEAARALMDKLMAAPTE